MIKICYITTISATIKAFVLETAKYLHEHGDFDISIICDNDDALSAMLPEYIHYYPVRMDRGIKLDGISAMLQMKKIIKREKFDLVQYATPNASLYAALASWMAKTPVRLYCQWGIIYVGFTGIRRWIFKCSERLVCKLSTWIEPDSYGNLKFSKEQKLYTESKSSVIWNGSSIGVDLSKFNIAHKQEWKQEIRAQYGIPADAFVYIFVGRITKDKGINELLAATKSIMTVRKDVYLLMVGNTEAPEKLDQELYKWSQEEERVLYTGFTNHVEKYLAASEVCVLASYREGFGTVVTEAEAMGVPVIVTDIPGPTDAMKRDTTGLVVQKADVVDLEQAMHRLYEDRDLRETLGAEAYEFASENFEQQELFSRILEDRRRLIYAGKQ